VPSRFLMPAYSSHAQRCDTPYERCLRQRRMSEAALLWADVELAAVDVSICCRAHHSSKHAASLQPSPSFRCIGPRPSLAACRGVAARTRCDLPRVIGEAPVAWTENKRREGGVLWAVYACMVAKAVVATLWRRDRLRVWPEKAFGTHVT